MVLPIVGKTLIESRIFFGSYIFSLSHPDWLIFIDCFEFGGNFFDLLLFLFLLFNIFFFDFDFIVFLFTFWLFWFFIIIRNFFFSGLFNLEVNLERNKF